MPTQINVVFVYGAGPDNRYGEALRHLRECTINEFGSRIYSPEIIDHKDGDRLAEWLSEWNDPTILVGHSCGSETVTEAANNQWEEVIPFIMAIAPSIYCDPDPVGANVARITQASSDENDNFNPRNKTLISVGEGNTTTVLDVIYTGMPHLEAPYSPLVQERLFAEINRALTGDVTPPEPQPEPEPKVVTVTIKHPVGVTVTVEKIQE